MENKETAHFHTKMPPLQQLNKHKTVDVRYTDVELEKILITLHRIETKLDVLLMQNQSSQIDK